MPRYPSSKFHVCTLFLTQIMSTGSPLLLKSLVMQIKLINISLTQQKDWVWPPHQLSDQYLLKQIPFLAEKIFLYYADIGQNMTLCDPYEHQNYWGTSSQYYQPTSQFWLKSDFHILSYHIYIMYTLASVTPMPPSPHTLTHANLNAIGSWKYNWGLITIWMNQKSEGHC